MNRSPLLATICTELTKNSQVHTVLLYGSRADGTENQSSDYDIAAFGAGSGTMRDTRCINGEFLDVFIYPDSALKTPSDEYLRLRNSVVLAQRGHEAQDFLAKLDAIFYAGPQPLASDEMLARKAWAWKMVLRLERNDIESGYRRVWLLTALLEDYFHIRGRWFQGPKKSFQWLQENDPLAFLAFEAALRPDASIGAIQRLVENVVGKAPNF